MLIKYFSIAVVIFYFSTTVIQVVGQDGKCPDGTLEAPDNNCFKFISDPKTFSDAEHSCFLMGGHLAVVDSSFTNTFLAENAKGLDSLDFWIGANVYTNLNNRPWLWTDSYKFLIYTDWANGQPSGGETGGGQCAAASVTDGTWSAADCSSTKPYICIVPRAYNCPSEWIYFEESKSCYKVFFWATWQDAENICVNNSAHLTSIHSDAENTFIISISRDGNNKSTDWQQYTWIGLFTTTNDNSVWQWSDGSPVNYINWVPDNPSNQGEEKCVQLMYDYVDTTYNHFANYFCEKSTRNYVCKKPATVLNLN